MSGLTPEEAKGRACPLARSFERHQPTCLGPACMLWRWLPLSAEDPRFRRAVRAEMKRLAEAAGKASTAGSHREAVRNVTADPAAHGAPSAPERGYCGLGGRPEA